MSESLPSTGCEISAVFENIVYDQFKGEFYVPPDAMDSVIQSNIYEKRH